MMKTMITLMATAVLFAITSIVAEAAKKNPSPLKKPAFESFSSEESKQNQCDFDLGDCMGVIKFFCSTPGRETLMQRYQVVASGEKTNVLTIGGAATRRQAKGRKNSFSQGG